MSRCPQCGSKECCGADLQQQILELDAEVIRLHTLIATYLSEFSNDAEQALFDALEGE